MIHFKGLNGIRSIAAIAVVFSHITISLGEFNLNPYIFGVENGKPKGLLLAGFGVSIFFVLSGFLITYLIQIEKEHQVINIKKFYMRRILRIWPLYYVYLIITLLVLLFNYQKIDLSSLLFYIFYSANIPFITGKTIQFLAHYWSLGVEEQFYLFWPWVNKYTKSILRFCVVGIFLLFGLKMSLHIFFPNTQLEQIIHVTRFHCMLIGALGAILYKSENKYLIKIIDTKIVQSISWFIIFLVTINQFHIASFVDNEIISVIALFIIIGQIKERNRIVNLDLRIFNFLGNISFGIYVIHPILIYLTSKIIGDLQINYIIKYLIIYTSITGLTIFFAHLSFITLERYFLKFKANYTIIKSSSIQNKK
jgi:peptidoglycan/LPS O-acetylase OafA/YrhL